MAKARAISGVAPDSSFREAAADAVEVRTEELFSFSEGVLDTGDVERVHDMRVASRRLRAVLEVFAPCFPKKELRRTLREVKALADDLGERRDPDVAIAALERVGAGLAAPDRPGLDGLIAELSERQQSGNTLLARRLERVEEIDLRARLLALAAATRTA
ncbi:MAG: CHAD domain-containing protein [Thermoleophilaceae bacterium]|jgi:CHAD domain-containing protein